MKHLFKGITEGIHYSYRSASQRSEQNTTLSICPFAVIVWCLKGIVHMFLCLFLSLFLFCFNLMSIFCAFNWDLDDKISWWSWDLNDKIRYDKVHYLTEGLWTPDHHTHIKTFLHCCQKIGSTQLYVFVCCNITLFLHLNKGLKPVPTVQCPLSTTQDTACQGWNGRTWVACTKPV